MQLNRPRQLRVILTVITPPSVSRIASFSAGRQRIRSLLSVGDVRWTTLQHIDQVWRGASGVQARYLVAGAWPLDQSRSVDATLTKAGRPGGVVETACPWCDSGGKQVVDLVDRR